MYSQDFVFEEEKQLRLKDEKIGFFDVLAIIIDRLIVVEAQSQGLQDLFLGRTERKV